MPAVLNQADGLHLLTRSRLEQLANDETLASFADGLIPQALAYIGPTEYLSWPLARILYHAGYETYPLLTALLVLDAEVSARQKDKTRTLPLPAFLSYRSSLSQTEISLSTLRLPALNPGGRYDLAVSNQGFCCAARLDLHPHLQVAGHVRLAISSLTRSPIRLRAAEEYLERQVLIDSRLEDAISAGSMQLPTLLSASEKVIIRAVLYKLGDAES